MTLQEDIENAILPYLEYWSDADIAAQAAIEVVGRRLLSAANRQDSPTKWSIEAAWQAVKEGSHE